MQRYYPGPLETKDEAGAQNSENMERAIEEAQDRLQSSLSLARSNTTGLGIGLNLTYSLVRALGGELRFESKPGDTRFWFALPAENAQTHSLASSYSAGGGGAAAKPPPQAFNWDSISSDSDSSRLGIKESSGSGSDSDGSGTFRVAKPRTFVEMPSSGEKCVLASNVANQGLKACENPHVLVAEDTEMCAVVVRMLLSKFGCSSDHAENGAEAVKLMKLSDFGLYNLVIMDLRMPEMDGFEATRIIREDLRLTDVPVIALTADDSFDIRTKCVEMGFTDFARKPLTYETMAQLLKKHTGHVMVGAEPIE